MKGKGKWTPHIIAAVTLAVFVILGLACATQPSTSTARQYSTITFRNETGETIFYLYISERTDDSWGSDWLGTSNVLSNGNSYTTRLLTGQYDVKATNLNKDVSYIFWIEVDASGGTFVIDSKFRQYGTQ